MPKAVAAVAGLVGVAGLAVAGVTAVGAPASAHAGSAPAATESVTGATAASFKGRKINLAGGWDGAQSCAVVSVNDVRCHSSNAEANAALAAAGLTTTRPVVTRAAVAVWPDICPNGWLCLYQDEEFYGRRLLFRDEGWQSLWGYGFAHQTSSWWNTQACDDAGGLGDGVGGVIFISGCGARAERLGFWNDRAVDVGG